MEVDTVTLAAFVTGAVALLREETADRLRWTRGRSILVTLVVAQIVTLGAMILGYLPLWLDWQASGRTGFEVFLTASGLYAVGKPLIESQTVRKLAAEHSARVVRVARRKGGDGAA